MTWRRPRPAACAGHSNRHAINLRLTVLPLIGRTRWVGTRNRARHPESLLAALGGGDIALWLEFAEPRRVSAEDRAARHRHRRAPQPRDYSMSASSRLARDTSLTLQRSMLAPTELPAGFAVRYEPTVSPLEIGGDWYDVLPVGDDRIGIIVGDCVGRGLSAAAVMGQLRSSAPRAAAHRRIEPATLLEQLDSVASTPSSRMRSAPHYLSPSSTCTGPVKPCTTAAPATSPLCSPRRSRRARSCSGDQARARCRSR